MQCDGWTLQCKKPIDETIRTTATMTGHITKPCPILHNDDIIQRCASARQCFRRPCVENRRRLPVWPLFSVAWLKLCTSWYVHTHTHTHTRTHVQSRVRSPLTHVSFLYALSFSLLRRPAPRILRRRFTPFVRRVSR